ncbi:hypothetical protein Aperf_G00000046381 [Anoplocephala perfoliata]
MASSGINEDERSSIHRIGDIDSTLKTTLEMANNISAKLVVIEEQQQEWNKERRDDGNRTGDESVFSTLTKIEDIVSSLQEQMEKSEETRTNNLEDLKKRVEELNAQVNVSEVAMEIMEKLATIEADKLAKSDLDCALKKYEAIRFADDVNERSNLKDAVCGLTVDLDNAIQRLKSVERLVKSRISTLEAEIQAKADNTEIMSTQSQLQTKLQQLRNRLKILVPDDYLNEVVENRKSREEAAGLRRKVILHCISCDRPLLISERGWRNNRGNYIDPPYLRNNGDFYDAYQTKRSIGGSHTILKPEYIQMLPKKSPRTSSVPKSSIESENGEAKSPELIQDNDVRQNENNHDPGIEGRDEVTPVSTAVTPPTSPKHSDGESEEADS